MTGRVTKLILLLAKLLMCVPAIAATPVPDDVSRIVTAFEAKLSQPNYRYTGAILVVVRNGKVAFLRGYGHQDAAGRHRVDPGRTQFWSGSVGKTFTAIAIARLIDEGRIGSIDDSANLYLPEGMKLPANRGVPITLRMLATHQAGFEEIMSPDLPASQPTPVLDGRYFRANLPKYIVPANSGMNYSNFGAGVLGIIAANLNHESYSEVVRHTVLIPLGMSGSIILDKPQQHPFLAKAQAIYANGGTRPIPDDTYSNPIMLPAGAVASTGVDMARYMIALLGGNQTAGIPPVASERSRTLLFTSLGGQPPLQTRALLFGVGSWNGTALVEHGGRVVGAGSQLTLIPQRGLGIFLSITGDADQTLPLHSLFGLPDAPPSDAALANRAVPSASMLRGAILTSLLQPLRKPEVAGSARLAPTTDYAGEFVGLRAPLRSVRRLFLDVFLGGTMTVRADGDGVKIGSRRFEPVRRDVFWFNPASNPTAAAGFSDIVIFHRGRDGRVDGLSNGESFSRADGLASPGRAQRALLWGSLIAFTGLLSPLWIRRARGRVVAPIVAAMLIALPVVFFRSWPATPVAALSFTLTSPADFAGFQILSNCVAIGLVAIVVLAILDWRTPVAAQWRARLAKWHLRVIATGAALLIFAFARFDLIGWNLA